VERGSVDDVAVGQRVPVNRGVLVPSEPRTDRVDDRISQLFVGDAGRSGKRTGRMTVEPFAEADRETIVLEVGGGSEGLAGDDVLRSRHELALRRTVVHAAERFDGRERVGRVSDLADDRALDGPEDSGVVCSRQVADGVIDARTDVARYLHTQRHRLYRRTARRVRAVPAE